MIESFSGYCPEQDCSYEVDLSYYPIKVLGSLNPKHKISLEYCEYSDEKGCSQKSACPLIKQAYCRE